MFFYQPTVPAEGRSQPRIGNIGHLTRISNKLIQLGNNNSEIQAQLQVCISISLYLYLLLFKVYGKKVKHSVMDCSPVLDGCFRGSQTPSTSFLPLVIFCFLCTWVAPPRLVAMIFYLIIKKLIFFWNFI